jgi:tetratricopeptide (TPR) repeat protein
MSENQFDYDVFISYSNRDKEWVRGELLKRIEAAGLKAFIDCQDIRPGGASLAECERGVRQSRKALLILTPNYLESRWCRAEMNMIQTLDPDNTTGLLIPALKSPCEKPLRISSLSHIDFTEGTDLYHAWRQLLTALGAPPDPPKVQQPERGNWFLAYPYAMPANFTGRANERAMLSGWLEADATHPLLVLRALGGFGKSSLAWHWLMHDVRPSKWPHVVWWSFYEGDASFESFVVDSLTYLTDGAVKPDAVAGKNAAVKLLKVLHRPGTLLVLDGFERALRAFGGLNAAYQGDEEKPESGRDGNERDCISPIAHVFLYNVALHPGIRSKVLLTTRLLPKVLEERGGGLVQGCREEELSRMQRGDAVAFFHAKGIRGSRAEIEFACAPYGYHPLSLCLLAGLIVRDFQQPGDIAAAKRLDVSGDLVQRQHHVLEHAYNSLTPARQTLLSRIACFRGPVGYDALRNVAEAKAPSTEDGTGAPEASATGGQAAPSPSPVSIDGDLHDLISRGLLHHDTKVNRFDLHPIVRRYAYDRLTPSERTTAHTRLLDYFAAVPKPEKINSLDDLGPVMELYYHTVRAGHYEEAQSLFRDRIHEATYFQFGAYELRIDLLLGLFPDGEDRPPRLKDENDQAWTLNELAISYGLIGQPRKSLPLVERYNLIYEKRDESGKGNLSAGLRSLASSQVRTGALRMCETSLRRSLELAADIKNEFQETMARHELGRLLAYRGRWAEAENELLAALGIWEKRVDLQGQFTAWAYRAHRELIRLRQVAIFGKEKVDYGPAIDIARRSFEISKDKARASHPNERDFVRAHWLLGASLCAVGELVTAESHLNQSLERCRRINLVDAEAGILIELARLRIATEVSNEAKQLAEEALAITERCGYVLQGADAHLVLAQLAKAKGDKEALKHHATKAKRLATCEGPPDYTYKVAYDEAEALLASLDGKQPKG